MTDEKILDLKSALEDLADDMEIYKDVLTAYLDDAPELIEELNTAFEKNDIELLHRQAHSLKSSSRSIGGMRLGSAAAELEANAKAGDLANAQDMLEKIKEEFGALKQELSAAGVLE